MTMMLFTCIDRYDHFIKINGVRINIVDIQNFLKTNSFGTITIKVQK